MSPDVPGPSAVRSADDKKWYVVKVQSGREEAIKEAIERRVRREELVEFLGRIVIPAENVIEVRNGRRSEHVRKLFPGYLICEVAIDDRLVSLFRETPGVSDFVGGGSAPVALSAREVETLLVQQPLDGEDRVKVILPRFERGERVSILGGAFAEMEGEVEEVLGDTGQVRVHVTILGRDVPLDVEACSLRQLG